VSNVVESGIFRLQLIFRRIFGLTFPKMEFLEQRVAVELKFLSLINELDTFKFSANKQLLETKLASLGKAEEPEQEDKAVPTFHSIEVNGKRTRISTFVGMGLEKKVKPEELDKEKQNFSVSVNAKGWKIEGYFAGTIAKDSIRSNSFPKHFISVGAFEKMVRLEGDSTLANGIFTFEVEEEELVPFNI
jgi:hypothetical protein